MTLVRRWAWWATAVGLVGAGAGLVVLFVYSFSEVLANPSLTLVDGYWIGRLPWTAIGVDLTVLGGTVAVVFGAVTAWFAGGAIRRLVAVLALAVTVFWWFVALLPPPQGAPCSSCSPPGPDPISMAYSQPDIAVLFLLLPAAIAGVLALSSPRTRHSADANGAAVQA